MAVSYIDGIRSHLPGRLLIVRLRNPSQNSAVVWLFCQWSIRNPLIPLCRRKTVRDAPESVLRYRATVAHGFGDGLDGVWSAPVKGWQENLGRLAWVVWPRANSRYINVNDR